MKHKSSMLFFSGLAALALILACNSSPAIAETSQTYIVNDQLDAVDSNPGNGVCETAPGNGICTLRAAVMEANADVNADYIYLPAGTYHLTIPGASEYNSETGDLNIIEGVTLLGVSRDTVVIDADGLGDRVLNVAYAVNPTTISSITIMNGNISGAGGGIYSYAKLSINNVKLIANHASTFGGSISGAGFLFLSDVIVQSSDADIGGGAIIYDFLSIKDSVFLNNHANQNGGGLVVGEGAEGIISGSNFVGNDSAIPGGGIYTRGQLSVINTTITNNQAVYGGGIANAVGQLTLEDVNFYYNSASYGGALYNDQAGIISGQNLLFSDNTGAYGGALINEAGTIYINRSIFINNTAYEYGGAISNHDGFYLRDSTINNNSAAGNGGGIFNDLDFSMKNTTISQNESATNGGGIYNSGNLSSYNNTIVNNLASSDGSTEYYGGGIFAKTGSLTSIYNSLLYGNTFRHGDLTTLNDCYGTLYTRHYNLIGYLTSVCTLDGDQGLDIIGENPLLGTLLDNGGSTPTHALLDGSPAIEAGNPSGCIDQWGNVLSTDQRGFPRHWDGNGDGIARCDIGAYEYGSKLLIFLPVLLK